MILKRCTLLWALFALRLLIQDRSEHCLANDVILKSPQEAPTARNSGNNQQRQQDHSEVHYPHDGHFSNTNGATNLDTVDLNSRIQPVPTGTALHRSGAKRKELQHNNHLLQEIRAEQLRQGWLVRNLQKPTPIHRTLVARGKSGYKLAKASPESIETLATPVYSPYDNTTEFGEQFPESVYPEGSWAYQRATNNENDRDERQGIRLGHMMNELILDGKRKVMAEVGQQSSMTPLEQMRKYKGMLHRELGHDDISKADFFQPDAPQLDESEHARPGNKGLSLAAALMLAIPPSILAVILATHLAKKINPPVEPERKRKRGNIVANTSSDLHTRIIAATDRNFNGDFDGRRASGTFPSGVYPVQDNLPLTNTDAFYPLDALAPDTFEAEEFQGMGNQSNMDWLLEEPYNFDYNMQQNGDFGFRRTTMAQKFGQHADGFAGNF